MGRFRAVATTLWGRRSPTCQDCGDELVVVECHLTTPSGGVMMVWGHPTGRDCPGARVSRTSSTAV